MNRLRGGIGCISLASVALGCHLLLDLQTPEPGAATPFVADSGPPGDDAAGDAGEAGPDPCASRSVPAPPSKDDAPTVELPAQYFAVMSRSVVGADGQLVTMNIDGLRTCAPSAAFEPNRRACIPNGSTEVGCDLDSCGGENQLGALSMDGGIDLQSNPNKSATDGLSAFMIYISGYNGEANDKNVTVGLARSVGIYSDEGCDGKSRGRRAESGTDRPRRDGGAVKAFRAIEDGCDRWLLAQDDLARAPSIEPKVTAIGYVSNNVLVARTDARSPFPIGANLEVSVTGTIVLARIERSARDAGGGANFLLSNIVVASRLPLGDFLPTIGVLNTGLGLLCELPQYKALADSMCAAADLTATANTDDGELACDSVSSAFAMRAAPSLPTRDPMGITFDASLPQCDDTALIKGCGSR